MIKILAKLNQFLFNSFLFPHESGITDSDKTRVLLLTYSSEIENFESQKGNCADEVEMVLPHRENAQFVTQKHLLR
jgi:hypothetical protein